MPTVAAPTPMPSPPGPSPADPTPSHPPPGHPSPPPAAPVAFGADQSTVQEQAAAGAHPDAATLWLGAWTLRAGWRDTDAALADLHARGILPVIQVYYWGDDIAPACFPGPCHGKDVAGWDLLLHTLVDHLNASLRGDPAVVVLETEFNKGAVAHSTVLDHLLGDRVAWLHRAYPASRVAVGFGNWNPAAWTTWANATAAADLLGLQGIYGATRDANASRASLPQRTLEGARQLQAAFGKPIVLDDLAVSSYQDPGAVGQAGAVAQLLSCLPQLKAAGVQMVVYRAFTDAPGASLAEYYGEAERHFGLVAGDGPKPALDAWVTGVERERAAPATPIDAAAC